MKIQNPTKLLFAILICQAAGFLGAFFTTSAIPGWYETLIRPEFSPPNWVFGPVWTVLYLLMGIAVYLIWINKKRSVLALRLFGLQLLLNGLWSIIFFGLQNPFWAMLELGVLLVLVAATILEFRKINKTAAWLLMPYIIWSAFAFVLNFSIWQLNA